MTASPSTFATGSLCMTNSNGGSPSKMTVPMDRPSKVRALLAMAWRHYRPEFSLKIS
jgi:hypothetical protein